MSDDKTPTLCNATLLQGFEWNVPADGKHWVRLNNELDQLKHIGITSVWIPPACKASSPEGNGYDIYDLFDLGDYDQKGQKATKWGSGAELRELCKKAKEQGIGIYFDAVLNHKAGADHTEKCRAIEVQNDDRTKEVGEGIEIEGWLGFDFPGRGEQISKQKYHWDHFTGTDYDAKTEKNAIFRILGDNKGWSNTVDSEGGNADFLMFADLDYSHPEVIADVLHWGEWVVKELNLSGFRFDAVQHFSERFTNEFVEMLEEKIGKDKLFLVGEFWNGDSDLLCKWLKDMNHKFSLYDSPLLNKFSSLSSTEKGDLRSVFDGSLVKASPTQAVTVVMNHDTQPGQTVATPIEGFFKPLAYALILLRLDGYPAVFYGDLYGTKGEHAEPPTCGGKLADLVLARKLYAYGVQEDYFNEANCVGWVRRGTHDKPAGCAVVLSNAEPGQIKMAVGEMHAGEVWTDVLGWSKGEVKIDDDGYGMFNVSGTSIAVWVNKDAAGRDLFGKFNDDIYQEGKK